MWPHCATFGRLSALLVPDSPKPCSSATRASRCSRRCMVLTPAAREVATTATTPAARAGPPHCNGPIVREIAASGTTRRPLLLASPGAGPIALRT